MMLEVILIGLFAALVLYALSFAIYNLYFHPLAKYPGPFAWRATRLSWVRALLGGRAPHILRDLHDKYGDVVRVAPGELSFIIPEAWQDVYGHGNMRRFMKDPMAYQRPPDQPVDTILNAKDADHTRFRRLLSHAFSEKALREQQELIGGHVELLIQRLRERAGQQLDMVRWYNYTTFDLIGDLAFGEPFGCLQSSEYHPWVALIFGSIRAVTTFSFLRGYISPEVLKAVMPKRLLKKREDHVNLTHAKLKKRLESDTSRADFMTYVLRHNDEKGMSEAELQAHASLLILAGSETTATALSGTTYCLLRAPQVLKAVTDEIRGKFTHEDEMTLAALAGCEYLNLVLREGLRMYPPVPVGLPRKVLAEDTLIGGYHVPKDTVVGMPQWPAYRSTRNFLKPNTFDPSRWARGVGEEKNPRAGVFEPFSIGPRNCIGQNLAWAEMRLILARVLFNFDLELLNDDWNPEKQSIYVLWSKPSLDVRVKDRFAST